MSVFEFTKKLQTRVADKEIPPKTCRKIENSENALWDLAEDRKGSRKNIN